MAEIASAFVSLLPSAKGFGKKTEQQISGEMKSSGSRTGKVFGGAMAVAAGAAVAGVAAVGVFAKGAIEEARDAQKVGALTASTIKATGGAAKVTAKQVADLAGAISAKTGIDDETIQSGQNMLLTFKNIRNEAGKGNDIFNQTSKTLVDLSAAMGTEPKQAAIQLGKALNDPIKGVSALSRVGVTFTESQKEQIKTLVESGRTMDAQKIILRELNSEFGGAAEAQATAGDKFKVAFGNLQEAVGTALLPVLDKALGALTKVTVFASENVGPAIAGIGEFFKPVAEGFKTLFGGPDVRDSANGFAEIIDNALGNTGNLVAPLQKAGEVIRAFAAGFGALKSAFQSGNVNDSGIVGAFERVGVFLRQALPAVREFAASFVATLMPAIRTAANTFSTVLLPAILNLGRYLASNLFPIFQQIAGIIAQRVVPILVSLAQFFYGTVYPAVVKIAVAVGKNLKPVFDALFQVIRNRVLPAANMFLAKLQEWMPTIKKVIGVVLVVTGTVLKFASAVLGKVLPPLIKFAGFLFGTLFGAVVKVIGILVKIIATVINVGSAFVKAITFVARFQAAVLAQIGKVIGYVRSIPGKILSALGNVGSILYNAGTSVIQGFIDGITSKIGEVRSKLSELTNMLPDWKGPKKRDKTILFKAGQYVIRGFVDGLRNQFPNVKKALSYLTDQVGKSVDRMKSLKDAAKQFAASVAGTFKGDLFGKGASGLLLQLQADTNDANAMRQALRRAASRGLSGGLYKELAASGDLNTAQQIANSSAAQIAAYERAYAARNKATAALGGTAANQMYGAQMRELSTELRQLRRVQERLESAVERGARRGVGDRDRNASTRRRAGK